MEGLVPRSVEGLVLGNPTFVRCFKTERMRKCVEDYFLGEIENDNTRLAYGRAVRAFLTWCDLTGIPDLETIRPPHVRLYLKTFKGEATTTKQHRAAVKVFFDVLVSTGELPVNPAASVKGPKLSISRGKTPVLSAEDTRKLLETIPTQNTLDLRDRALLACMFFSFARISAVLGLNVEDYHRQGPRFWLRLKEKGGKLLEVPVHHKLEEMLGEYLEASGLGSIPKSPLFPTGKFGVFPSIFRLDRRQALRIMKKRLSDAEICIPKAGCHSLRATGITTYLQNGGLLEKAQKIAGHASAQTTKLYDRTQDIITIGEIERIRY